MQLKLHIQITLSYVTLHLNTYFNSKHEHDVDIRLVKKL